MRLEDDLDRLEKAWKITTLNELYHNLFLCFILEIYFILLSFKSGYVVLNKINL